MKTVQCWNIPRNDIPVFFQPDQGSHTVSSFVRVGGMSDPPGILEGRAHILEHVVANRVRHISSSELQAMLRTYSAHHWRSSGIWTSHMNTSYGCGLLRRRDYILDLFPVLAQMITDPLITPEILRVEQGAILTEWGLHGEDNIEDRVMRKLLKLIYKKNPVLLKMDCDPDQMMSPSTLTQLKRFWREQYVASNIGTIIFGPDRQKVRNMALKAFGELPPKEAPLIPYDTSDIFPTLGEVRREEFHYGDEENKTFHLLMGFPTDAWGGPLDDALDILAETLEFLLEDEIRDRNLNPMLGTYHPQVWIQKSRFHGLLGIWIPTISLEGAKRAEEIVKQQIQKIRDGRIFESLLEEAMEVVPQSKERSAANRILKRVFGRGITSMRRPIVDGYMEAFITEPHTLAELVTEHYCNGGIRAIERLNQFRKILRAVTMSDVIEAANRYLKPESYACVLAKPINPLNFKRFERA